MHTQATWNRRVQEALPVCSKALFQEEGENLAHYFSFILLPRRQHLIQGTLSPAPTRATGAWLCGAGQRQLCETRAPWLSADSVFSESRLSGRGEASEAQP